MFHFFKPLSLMRGAIVAPLLGLAALAGGGINYMIAMPGTSYHGPLPELTADERELATRLQRHVTAIGSEEHNVAHYAQLERTARYLETALTRDGHTVKQQVFASEAGSVRNLEVSLPAARAGKPLRKVIVVGAHYDSAPGTPGANDNATGAAAIVELAHLLKKARIADDHELKLVLFVNEEEPYFKSGQMGSWVHARDLHVHGRQVSAMLSLETIGYYSDAPRSQRYPAPLNAFYPDTGNFIGFVGDVGSRALVHQVIASFRQHASFPSEGIAAPASIPGIDWSDHWAYRQFDIPAIMVTDTAPYRYPHYHTAHDTPDKVDYDRLARVVTGLERVITELANPQPQATRLPSLSDAH